MKKECIAMLLAGGQGSRRGSAHSPGRRDPRSRYSDRWRWRCPCTSLRRWRSGRAFGIMSVDGDDRITEFAEKPKEPKSNLASMGIYIFTWKKLREYLIRDENTPGSENDFGKNIIPGDGAVGPGALVPGQHGGVVHLIDMVAGED